MPAYNESKYIGDVLRKVGQVTQNIVVVDDGSADETAQIAGKYVDHFLIPKVNLGKGAVLKTGCEYAFKQLKAQAVIIMDSDDQHDPGLLPDFFAHLASGSQVIFGERAMDSRMPLTRIIGNRLASVIVLILFGQYIPDIPSGFKAFTKSAYRQLKWQESGYGVEMEIAANVAKRGLKYNSLTIPTIYHDADKGMTLLNTFEMINKVISWRLSK